MARFYFIRHGQADLSQANTGIYQGMGLHLLTLSETGKRQIEAAAEDERLKAAKLILTSPYGRALHSAAILSRRLGLEICVETDLHEWLADREGCSFLPQEEADRRFQALTGSGGTFPEGEDPGCESAWEMKQRVFAVLERHRECGCAIVCYHGVLMQYALGVPHPANGQIVPCEI